jgi:hypothetical protein
MIVAALTLAVAALPIVVRSRPSTPGWVRGIGAGVEDAEHTALRHPSWRLAGALGYLGFDIAVLWVCLRALGITASVPALVLAYNLGYLANALPIPGGIGVLDAGLAGALALYGVAPAHAAAAVLVYHAVALWVPGLGGLLAYLRLRPRLLNRERDDRIAARAGHTPAGRLPDVAARAGHTPAGRLPDIAARAGHTPAGRLPDIAARAGHTPAGRLPDIAARAGHTPAGRLPDIAARAGHASAGRLPDPATA